MRDSPQHTHIFVSQILLRLIKFYPVQLLKEFSVHSDVESRGNVLACGSVARK